MVMTVERVYTRQVPKSITGSELMFKKSANPMTGEDVLGLLGQIQHREPIGALILDAQIAQDKTARAKLVGALQATLAAMGKGDDLAYAMAEAAVHEVCDTNICRKCHGTGQVYSKKFDQVNHCNKCEGVGRIILTEAALLKSINQHLTQPLAKQDWQRRHYDDFMGAVDTLHRHASNAGHCARMLLDGMGE
jgi:RecJ-like exonuclease